MSKESIAAATAHSLKKAAERRVHIWSPVNKVEAWEGSQVIECPSCGVRLDLKNPAMKDRICVCGAEIICPGS